MPPQVAVDIEDALAEEIIVHRDDSWAFRIVVEVGLHDVLYTLRVHGEQNPVAEPQAKVDGSSLVQVSGAVVMQILPMWVGFDQWPDQWPRFGSQAFPIRPSVPP